jgi:hypothetical protein
MGMRFRELSVSVLARAESGGADRNGAYLLRAWSSSRFLAASERVFFSTPYSHAHVVVSASGRASIRLACDGAVAFFAEMRDDGSAGRMESTPPAEGGWSGPVFLPSDATAPKDRRSLFFARAAGLTETRPFRCGEDSFEIRPSRDCESLGVLVDSHFVPERWAVRPDATHAKSKTYRRTAALA